MTFTVLVSAKGSPGVTTSALALAAVWPRRVVLAECDPAGGDILAGFLRASTTPAGGLLDLALAARRGLSPNDVVRRCLRLSERDDRVLLLSGLTDPAHATAVVPVWPRIAAALRELGDADTAYDVLADAGRLTYPQAGDLVAGADRVLLVLRPTLGQVHHARHHLRALRLLRPDVGPDGVAGGAGVDGAEGGCGVGLLLVGDHPYGPGEVQAALGAPVIGVLAHDLRAAGALGDGAARGRWFDRSPLMRSARHATAALSVQALDERPAEPGQRAEQPAGQHLGQPQLGQQPGQPGGQLWDRQVTP